MNLQASPQHQTVSLPYPGAPDNEQRLIQLEQELRLDRADLFGPAEVALRRLNGVPTTAAHVMCWVFIARWHFYSSDLDAVKECSAIAVSISELVSDPLVRVKALKMHATALSESGDLDESIPVQLRALEDARQLPDSASLVAELLNNLGITLHYGARYGAAHECLQQAVELSPTPTIWTNLCDLFLDVGEIQRSLDAAQRSLAMLRNPLTQEQRLTRMHVCLSLVLLFVRIGDLAQAQVHAEQALGNAKDAGDRARELARLGTLLIDAHDPSKANSAIDGLLNQVRDVPARTALYRTYCDVAVAAMQAAGRPSQALQFVDEMAHVDAEHRSSSLKSGLGIEISKQAGVYDELADAHLRDRQDSLQKQTVRLVAARTDRIQRLIDMAIRAELREEEPLSEGRHAYRVARLAELLAQDLRCSDDEIQVSRLTGLLHDLGKLYVSDTLLLKQPPLTDAEIQLFKRHADDGARLIESVPDPSLIPVAKAVRHVYERWDGSGYPAGLQGQSVPISARIVAICNAFDTMTHWRPYRVARSFNEAITEIERASETAYDPALVRTFVAMVSRLNSESEDLDALLAEGSDECRVVQEQRTLRRLLRV